MAFTLNWNCSRNCTVMQMFYECNASYTQPGSVGTNGYMILDPAFSFVNPSNGLNSVGLGLDVLDPAVWNTLTMTMKIEATANQQDLTNPATWTMDAWIRLEMACIDPVTGVPVKTLSVKVRPTAGGVDECNPTGTLVHSRVTASAGAGIGQQWKSAPLAACTSAQVNMGGFPPPPNYNNPTPPGGFQCLCPAGGTPPYTYHIAAGFLREGQTLNPNTGCIEGTPTPGGFPGSPVVTFGGTDGGGQTTTLNVPFGPAPPASGFPTMLPAQSFGVIILPDPSEECK